MFSCILSSHTTKKASYLAIRAAAIAKKWIKAALITELLPNLDKKRYFLFVSCANIYPPTSADLAQAGIRTTN